MRGGGALERARMGAGCGPGCMNSALAQIITIAEPPMNNATDSRG